MALETLRDIKSIGGFEVKRICWKQPDDNFIEVNDGCNAITFKIQNGAIKEVGVNGCQVITMIETAKLIIEGLNNKFPCKENRTTIKLLSAAIVFQNRRTRDRELRGVEGKNEK
jgi:hypothetical protein